NGTGTFIAVANGMTVEGSYGTLTVNSDGTYSYQVKAEAAAIGKVDVFTYKLVHPAAGEDIAKLFVQIGSKQADLEWDENDHSADARSVVATDNTSSAGIETVHQTTTETQAKSISYDWLIGALGVVIGQTKGSKTFSVEQQVTTDLTIKINVGTLVSLIDKVQFKLVKIDNGVETTIMDRDKAGLLDLIGIFGSNIQVKVEDLAAGTYRLDVSNGSVISLPGSVSVDLTFEKTHLDVETA